MLAIVGVFLAIPLILIALAKFYISRTVRCKLENRLDGKTIIITGGSSGIGQATALECARRGATVIIGCRDKAKAEATVTRLRTKSSNECVHYLPLDLAKLSSVREFATLFVNQFGTFHVLINNAAYLGPKAKTADGIDLVFQTNYLGHFYLTQLLLKKVDLQQHTEPLRIINLTSASYAESRVDFDDLYVDKTKYDMYDAYGRTKQALILFSTELNFKFPEIITMSVHPGAVYSGLLRNWPGKFGDVLRFSSKLLFRSPHDGAQSIIYCACKESVTNLAGKLVYDCNVIPIEAHARDYKSCERLWDVSLSICGLTNKSRRNSLIPD